MLNMSDMIRGYTDTIILAQLLLRDSYGYEINRHVAQATGGLLELKEATLYTTFRRLEQAGCILSLIHIFSGAEEGDVVFTRYETSAPAGGDTQSSGGESEAQSGSFPGGMDFGGGMPMGGGMPSGGPMR